MRGVRLVAACMPLVIVSLACGSGAPAEEDPMRHPEIPAPEPAPEEEVEVEPAPDPNAPFAYVVRTLTFDDDLLEMCMEATITVARDTYPADAEWPPTPSPFTSDDENVLETTTPCAEQPNDPIATCVMAPRTQEATAERNYPRTMQGNLFYYRAATVFDRDLEMRDCLRLGGAWNRLEEDSSEVLAARMRESRRDLERLRRR